MAIIETSLCCGVRPHPDGRAKDTKLVLETTDPKVAAMEKDLQTEVAKSEEERRTSLSGVKTTLSNLSEKLENAQSKVSPWQDIAAAKQQLGDVQREVEQELDTAERALESQPEFWGSPKVDALAKELTESKQQRRRSLSDVQDNLSDLVAKLENAETSWAPWNQIKRASQQVDDATKFAEQGAGQVEQTDATKVAEQGADQVEQTLVGA